MAFSYDGHEYMNHKILKEFPVLQNIGWIFLKPDAKHNLLPFHINKTKDGKLLKE